MALIFIAVHKVSKESYRIEQDGTEEMFWKAVGSMFRNFLNKDKHAFDVACFEAWSQKDYDEKLKAAKEEAGN